jgi:hypothetical protein
MTEIFETFCQIFVTRSQKYFLPEWQFLMSIYIHRKLFFPRKNIFINITLKKQSEKVNLPLERNCCLIVAIDVYIRKAFWLLKKIANLFAKFWVIFSYIQSFVRRPSLIFLLQTSQIYWSHLSRRVLSLRLSFDPTHRNLKSRVRIKPWKLGGGICPRYENTKTIHLYNSVPLKIWVGYFNSWYEVARSHLGHFSPFF